MADSVQAEGAKILVVDDEQIVLNLVEDTLTDEGYNVSITPSPQEAIEWARQKPFDFILTDIRMPAMNGIELVKEIRALIPTIGVIFMTGYANLDTAKQAIKEGAYDYIMKPFELSEIRQAITRAVEQKQNATKATLSQELNKIADLSNLIYSSGDLASLMRLSLSFALIQSNAEAGVAMYYDRANQEMAIMEAARHASGAEDVERFSMPAEDWDTVPLVRSSCLLNDDNKHPLHDTPLYREHRGKFLPDAYNASGATVIVPLVRGDIIQGFISLFHPTADYELKSSDIQFLNFVSSQLSISLENLKLLDDSREAYRRLEYLQDRTIQMEKMATRGQMSAEIGHELNNYLGVVVANFQLMNLRIQKGVTEGLERFTESIEDHLDKISRFTKGLMDYSSMKQATFEQHDINQLLHRIVGFLQPQKRFREFTFDVSTETEELVAEIDEGLIEQVLYNFLNNAADASADSDTKQIDIATSRLPDNMVRLSIKDHGEGISEENLKKLFNEKFTTKETGHGIGLVVCKSIIDKHRGRVVVNSGPGQGTEFVIELPVHHEITEKTLAGVS